MLEIVDPEGVGQTEPAASWPSLALAGGVAVAAASLVLAGVAGPPYLSTSSLNPWVAVFAVAAFAALFSVPFAANRRLVASDPERSEAWERAMIVWAGAALLAAALGALIALGGGLAPSDSLADAAGLLLMLEGGLVLITLVAWVLLG